MMKRAAFCLLLFVFFAAAGCGKKAPLRYPPAAVYQTTQ